jgi:hypothetical protein
LLERPVLLESLPTVELVTAVESSKNAREKEVSRVKIKLAEETMPSASTTKSV